MINSTLPLVQCLIEFILKAVNVFDKFNVISDDVDSIESAWMRTVMKHSIEIDMWDKEKGRKDAEGTLSKLCTPFVKELIVRCERKQKFETNFKNPMAKESTKELFEGTGLMVEDGKLLTLEQAHSKLLVEVVDMQFQAIKNLVWKCDYHHVDLPFFDQNEVFFKLFIGKLYSLEEYQNQLPPAQLQSTMVRPLLLFLLSRFSEGPSKVSEDKN